MGAPAHVSPQARAIAAATGAIVNVVAIGADLSAGFVLGSISAGADIAAAAAQRYVSRGTCAPLTCVLLVVPAVLHAFIVPDKYKDLWFSREQNADAHFIDRKALEFTECANKPDSTPLYSPLNDPRPHAPVYIHVAGQDPLRDDGLGPRRQDAPVYSGVPHGYPDMYPTFSVSRKAELDFVKATAWLPGKDLKEEEAAQAIVAASGATSPGSAV
ncbi:hypothetical protein AURDEDRAFT_134212 [Auricularia subglabra TFB-10046 SS5]|nr:hypothetical protein AURDEDRAFT_134212 [Auricularia subglabra TFB-10046 SS5]